MMLAPPALGKGRIVEQASTGRSACGLTAALVLQIRNMVAVQEVISSLEKYPITKEALEVSAPGLSTRAGSEAGPGLPQPWASLTSWSPRDFAHWPSKALKGGVRGACPPGLHCASPQHMGTAGNTRGFSSELRPLSLQEALHTLQGAAEAPVSEAGSRSRVLLPLPQCALT